MTVGPEVAQPGAVIVGCEAWSHVAGASVGVLVVHGFTGTPASLRGVAEAIAGDGHDVELPRLPGHGTSIDEMLSTDWAAWSAEVAEARDRLARRVARVVLVGQSMGATLVLRSALDDPTVAGVVCINPLTRVRGDDELAMLDDLLADGISVVPGGPSDIADPESSDVAYTATPLAPLKSLVLDGVAPITSRFAELTMPLRLFTSRNDHVVDPADSEHLAATFGGPVEHTWLERSYHVATRDYDRDLIIAESRAFVARVAS